MLFERRQFIMAIGAAALGVPAVSSGQSKMYGLIGKMRTQPGQRDALIAILLAGTGGMPGCLSYVVAKDPARLFNSSLDGNVRRAIDIREREGVDESKFKALVRQAVALNSSGRSKPSKKAKS